MSAQILDGTAVGKAIKDEVAAEVAEYSRHGLQPGLAVVLVGNDPASQIYVSSKAKTCAELGIYSEKIELDESTTTEELLELVHDLNRRIEIDGVLIQLPLPRQIDSKRVLNQVDPSKDVDGLHPVNVGRLTIGERGLRPCTPAGIMELLDRYQIQIDGRRAVVLGRSRLVGLPLSLLLLHRPTSLPQSKRNRANKNLFQSLSPRISKTIRRASRRPLIPRLLCAFAPVLEGT